MIPQSLLSVQIKAGKQQRNTFILFTLGISCHSPLYIFQQTESHTKLSFNRRQVFHPSKSLWISFTTWVPKVLKLWFKAVYFWWRLDPNSAFEVMSVYISILLKVLFRIRHIPWRGSETLHYFSTVPSLSLSTETRADNDPAKASRESSPSKIHCNE